MSRAAWGLPTSKSTTTTARSGARLTQDPTPGSPAAQLQLEPGDTIFELDGIRFRQHQDVLNHTAWTTMRFINVRTNGVQIAPGSTSPKRLSSCLRRPELLCSDKVLISVLAEHECRWPCLA